jgi:hypothetical protein
MRVEILDGNWVRSCESSKNDPSGNGIELGNELSLQPIAEET